MAISPLFYFAVATSTAFLATIPFGPINLAVIKTTVDYSKARGMEVAVAASLVEIVQAVIAIWFGMVISAFLEESVLVKAVLAAAFIALAVFIFTRKPEPSLINAEAEQKSFLLKGLVVALLNPQAVPFWIFAVAALGQYFDFDYVGIYLGTFLVGVFVGKLLALYGFVVASDYLKSHLDQSSLLVNRLLAAILLLLGLSQIWKILSP